ncbi:MAG: hypothetical protein GEU95_23785 [Rhizobiales bacterium]|nr:hypothetical protein [Hyphomicrobiales bacterium]
MARGLHRTLANSAFKRCIVPHVASKASVLASPHSGLSQRDRMTEARTPTSSPFSMLLDETGSTADPSRNPSNRASASAPALRSDVQNGDSPRPHRSDETTAAAPEIATSTRTEGTANQFKTVAAGLAAEAIEGPIPAADASDIPSDDEAITTDAALAMTVEAPSSPAQQPAVMAAPSLAGAPAPVPAAAETSAAAAPAGEFAAAIPVTGSVATEPELSQTQQHEQTHAPQAPDQTRRAAAMPHAKPSVESTVTLEPADLLQAATLDAATLDAATVEISVADPEHAGVESAPQQAARAETPSHGSLRPHTPEATERPSIAGPAGESVQSPQAAPDSMHLAHLQTGRDAGQTGTGGAQAAAQTADASNSMVSAPMPLESIAVEIAARAQNGRNRFEIRLDPPELGRIDVRLDIDRSGQVTSRLVVERVDPAAPGTGGTSMPRRPNPSARHEFGARPAAKSHTYAATVAPERPTRRISASARLRSGMKFKTRPPATTSKLLSGNGIRWALATRKSTRSLSNSQSAPS